MGNKGDFYVYHIYGVDNELLYVGKGSGDRHLSHLKGTSSNRFINEYFFSHGQDGSLTSKIVETFCNECQALDKENLDIARLRPSCNIQQTGRTPLKEEINHKFNFKSWCGMWERNPEMRDELRKLRPDYHEIVSVVGFDKVKGYHFHITKCTKLYQKDQGIDPIKNKVREAVNSLKLELNSFITLADLKSALQELISSRDIKYKPKATDILLAYDVKRARRFGSEGYIILNKISKRNKQE